MLTEAGIETPAHKEKWYVSAVVSILTNEKYKGDALLQKQYTVDFLSHKRKKNSGELQQYYIQDHHEAIIDPDTFGLVQAEMRNRREVRKEKRRTGNTIYSSKIICAECGNFYSRHLWHSTDKYKREVYFCSHKYKGDKICKTPHLGTNDIQRLFVKAVNRIISNKDELIENTKKMLEIVSDTAELMERANEIIRYNIFGAKMLVRYLEDGNKYLYDFLAIKKKTSGPYNTVKSRKKMAIR